MFVFQTNQRFASFTGPMVMADYHEYGKYKYTRFNFEKKMIISNYQFFLHRTFNVITFNVVTGPKPFKMN